MGVTLTDPLDHPWFELNYRGMISPQELNEALDSITEQALQNGKRRILADCRELQGGHSSADLLRLVERFDSTAMGRSFREAVLVQEGMAADAVRFYETVCRNRGFQVRVFSERSAAESWLDQFSQ